MVGPFLWLSFLAISINFVRSNPGGPPTVSSVCNNVMPDGSSPHGQQVGNGNYFVSTDLNATAGYYNYTAGQTYTG